MQFEYILFITISLMLSISSFLPALPITHWVVRMFDFFRVQLIVILSILFFIGVWFFIQNISIITLLILLFIVASTIYNLIIISPYLVTLNQNKNSNVNTNGLTVISVNVLQKNTQYNRLLKLVNKYQPDILLTIETNKTWENAIAELEKTYLYVKKIPKENTYGMHLYTNLKVKEVKEHYLISEDRPAIEAHLFDQQNTEFVLWCIHPPPPGPTEMPTSKQKDAELMVVAKMIRDSQIPGLVVGDFNNVCWSAMSKLFSKVSKLKDARLGRGIYGTFPVFPRIFRTPIDLIFNSKGIGIKTIKTLEDIGSDHLPLFTKFTIDTPSTPAVKKLKPALKEKVNEVIDEGKEAKQVEE